MNPFDKRKGRLFAALALGATAMSEPGWAQDIDWSAIWPVSDTRLASLRGGFETTTGLQLSFSFERVVYINGELLATTRLTIPDLANLMARANSAASLSGLINISTTSAGASPTTAGNGATTSGTSSATAATAASAASAASTIQANTAPALTSASVSPSASATSVPASSTTLAAANNNAAIVGTTPASAASVASSTPVVPTTATAATTVPSTTTPAPSSASTALPAAAASTSNSAATSSAAAAAASSPSQIIANGQVIQLPNASAIITGVQNSLNNQMIQVRTTIDATLASMSQLRSQVFADAMRQANVGSLR